MDVKEGKAARLLRSPQQKSLGEEPNEAKLVNHDHCGSLEVWPFLLLLLCLLRGN